MSRILLLLVFLIWLTGWSAVEPRPVEGASAWTGALPFVAFYVLLVLVLGLYSRLLARRVAADNLQNSLKRFSWMMLAARVLIPAWLAVGVFVPQMGWVSAVAWALGQTILPSNPTSFTGQVLSMVYIPGVLLGTLPALLAWVGLIWAQYPADRALREQNMLAQLDHDLPLHAPPRFGPYFWANLRLQVLFIVVPVLLIMAMHDVLLLSGVSFYGAQLTPAGPVATHVEDRLFSQRLQTIELVAQTVSAAIVFLLAPEVLRRVLQTEPLPPGPLRRRLEELCHRTGMRYRQILLWRTQNNMGNAAVMGFIPQVRYVLLSDLLLETMTDEQIEAVFAHEIGHVVHRHMAWYVVFFIILGMLFAGPGQALADQLDAWGLPEQFIGALGMMGFVGGMLLGFGFLSRRCERQADVYAARTMEAARIAGHGIRVGGGANGRPVPSFVPAYASAQVPAQQGATYGAGEVVTIAPPPASPPPSATIPTNNPPPQSFVGQYGANLFASALHRVAVVNNIPVKARSWCHGSIWHRMRYVKELSADPQLTGRFDRFMLKLYCGLIALLVVSGAFVAFEIVKG